MSKGVPDSRCSVNVLINAWSASQKVSASMHCSHTLMISSQLHSSFQKIHPSLWFLVFLIHQAIPKFIGDFTGWYCVFLNWENIPFFPPYLFIPFFFFSLNFRVLPRNGVVESQIRIILPRSSVKHLRASENYLACGGSCLRLQRIYLHP